MTPGQQAILDGFNANLTEHGQMWARTSDGAQIPGLPIKLEKSEPKLPGSNDRDLPILVADSSQPTPRLAKGNELTKGNRGYRVVREPDYDEATTLWTVLLSPRFL